MFARPLAAAIGPVAVALFLIAVPRPVSAEVTAEKSDDKVTIKIDGELFTEYLTNSGGKPILWPIIGPTGAAMTRAFPMAKAAGEATDHVHQRSFWFTHGAVNGVDFWMEGPKAGKQKHKEFVSVQGGKQATIVTRNEWVLPNGEKVLEDERRLALFPSGESRVIDFDITLTATNGPVTFGDTKEGSFGLRIAESMRADRKMGNGRIHNSEGQTDDITTVKSAKTWGRRAPWVDYTGPVKHASGKEEILGIAILNHPTSFRFPTYWHVRPYGLFAANPFGIHDFEGAKSPEGAGNYTLPQGQNLAFKYRVIFHKGATDEAQIKRAFDEYAADTKQAALK
jgi:hypothetical protein